MKARDLRDPLFKGCTRPAMVFGVPLTPLAVIGGVVILISVWSTIFIALSLFPITAVMRMMTKHDDQQFRLLWLKSRFQFSYFFRNGRFWQASVYSPLAFRKRKQK